MKCQLLAWVPFVYRTANAKTQSTMMMNVVAANNNIAPVSLERLRGECVKEVKRLNGAFSFDDAVSWQNGWEEND